MKFRIPIILLAFNCSFAIAQTQVPNGDFESWTLYPEGISGGGDFYMPVSADGTEVGLYNAVGNGWWHENMQNIAARFYNSAGYFNRYEEDDANGYALKLKGSGPSANGFIRFACEEVPTSLKGRYKFSNIGCDDFSICAYAVNSADTLTLEELFLGTVHSSAKSFAAPITESFQDFEIDLSDFKTIDSDYFVIMFSAYINNSCIKTTPFGDVFTNDPNGFAVVDDLELVYDTPTSVDHEFTEKDIVAFPNPTTGRINLKVSEIGADASIQLFDIVGNMLMEKQVESDVAQFDLKNFSPGVYFLHITKDMKKKTIKVVKQ
ncbi:T9SS type A sorting domain-containing protein [Allomuricauda taeanensis]|uniref:T9SS type A sorting domain-containing protein n=1 Tax=Flagellimonas taeanensis TaxID=1005926 RepID=UPI002E7B53FD|nr:T9SS type A sorting domain-containing protein [Allomuricauda taeanensis]MEE1963924.1 T9SS type A sorting domain-containing protein [Allomuricauda taeanensis]